MAGAGTTGSNGLELGMENFFLASQGLLPDGQRAPGVNLYEEDVYIASQGLAPDRPGLAGLACACQDQKTARGMQDYVSAAMDRTAGLRGLSGCVPGSGMGGLGWTAIRKNAAGQWVDDAGSVAPGVVDQTSGPGSPGVLDWITAAASGISAGVTAVQRDPALSSVANAGLSRLVPGGSLAQPAPQSQPAPSSWPSAGTIFLGALGVLGAGVGARKLGWI